MARILVFSGAGSYADPWHPFPETSGAVAHILAGSGHDVVVRESEPGSLRDLPAFGLLVINAGGRTGGPDALETTAWAGDHRAIEAFHSCGAPILGLHTAIGTFPDWPGWTSIIGGRWGSDTFHPDIDTATFLPADGAVGHPMWEGLESVEVFDERYSKLEVAETSVPLVQHGTNGETHTMGWLASGSVVYDGLGHDARSYESKDRQRLLRNEVRWLLAQSVAPGH